MLLIFYCYFTNFSPIRYTLHIFQPEYHKKNVVCSLNRVLVKQYMIEVQNKICHVVLDISAFLVIYKPMSHILYTIQLGVCIKYTKIREDLPLPKYPTKKFLQIFDTNKSKNSQFYNSLQLLFMCVTISFAI